MQQHTGQHILSAAFDRLFDNRYGQLSSRARYVDDRSCARDVLGGDRPRGSEANRVIWEDRAVAIRFVDFRARGRAAAAQGVLRKER